MSDPDLDPLDSARAARVADLDALAGLDVDELDYLARVDEIPDPSGEGVEHDDAPHLTDAEWAYIIEVSGG